MPDTRPPSPATCAKQCRFLAALAASPGGMHAVAVAAAVAGVHRATPYRWRATDPAFRAEWAAVAAAHAAQQTARVAQQLADRAAARERRLAELRPIYQQNAANARAAKVRHEYARFTTTRYPR